MDNTLRILLIGDCGCGKTSLILRLTENTFPQLHAATVGIDFKQRTIDVDGRKIKLMVFDTAGQERFRTITSSLYKSLDALIVVYDVTDMLSFRNVRQWFQEADRYAPRDTDRLLIGNKADLMTKKVVHFDNASEFAHSLGIRCMETSAKTNLNVLESFWLIASLAWKKKEVLLKSEPRASLPIPLHSIEKRKRRRRNVSCAS